MASLNSKATSFPDQIPPPPFSFCANLTPLAYLQFADGDQRDQTAMAKAAKSESTSSKVASAAAKVLQSKMASKEEKSVAASALTQKGSNETTSAKVAATAAKVLRSKTASKEAKAAAASALTQKTRKKSAA